jgi:hypothetical protein
VSISSHLDLISCAAAFPTKFIGGMKRFSTTEPAPPEINAIITNIEKLGVNDTDLDLPKKLVPKVEKLAFKNLDKDLPILQTCNEWNRRMEAATKKAAGKSYFLKTSKHGPVCHSEENPIHNKFRYCYMAAINHHIPIQGSWPWKPTVYTMSHFHWKYHSSIQFRL